jgi:hypothetical protein
VGKRRLDPAFAHPSRVAPSQSGASITRWTPQNAAPATALPQPAALNQLGGRFLTDFYLMVAQWAEWATGIVESWPDDPRQAALNPSAQDEAIRRAETTANIAQPSVPAHATTRRSQSRHR